MNFPLVLVRISWKFEFNPSGTLAGWKAMPGGLEGHVSNGKTWIFGEPMDCAKGQSGGLENKADQWPIYWGGPTGCTLMWACLFRSPPACTIVQPVGHWKLFFFNWKRSPQTVAHLAWKKGVCCGSAAFDITFQHKTTFSLETRNRQMNFAIFPNFGDQVVTSSLIN